MSLDVNLDEAAGKIIRLETVQDELRRKIEWVEEHDRQERLSIAENIAAVERLTIQVDTVLRGADGSNGLCSKVRHLESRLEIHTERLEGMVERVERDARDHYVHLRRLILGLVATIIGAVTVKALLPMFGL